MSYRSVFRGGFFAGRHAVLTGGGSGDSRKVPAYCLSICREGDPPAPRHLLRRRPHARLS